MKTRLQTICDYQEIIKTLINESIDDSQETIANKVAAIMYGATSATQKNTLVKKLMVDAGLVAKSSHVHAKTNTLIASQVSTSTYNEEHYVATIIEGEFLLVKFDPLRSRELGTSCHGTLHHSDAYRVDVNSFGELVFAERVTYA
jgi:hypothetical protein